jgi:hypothetical protein
MTDTREPDEPEPATRETRDERLGALLAVPPLDEVTRRRLVRDALDRPMPRPSRVTAALSIAAAVAVGIVVGTVLVHGNNEVATTTAQGAPTASAGSEALKASPGAAADSQSPVTPLGELGDVTAPGDLRDAINVAFEKSAGPTEQTAILGYPCASTPPQSLDLVATTALGLGTYRGFPVTIFIGTSPEGRALAVIVRQDDCTLLGSVGLPPV